MSLPDVSIVIPTYNRKDMLREAVESCLCCSDISIEVIVVDDGSTDGTGAMLSSSFQDSRLRYVFISHGGASRARNIGIRHAQGTALWFLDSDDILIEKSLKQIFNTMRENNCDIVITPFITLNTIDGTQEIIQSNVCRRIQIEQPTHLFSVFLFCNEETGCNIEFGSSALYLTSFIRRHSLWWDERLPYHQDYFFLLVCAVKAPSVSACLSPSFFYRQHCEMQRISQISTNNKAYPHTRALIFYLGYRKAEETVNSELLDSMGRKWFASKYYSLALLVIRNWDLYHYYLNEAFRIYPEFRSEKFTKQLLWYLCGPRNSDLLIRMIRNAV